MSKPFVTETPEYRAEFAAISDQRFAQIAAWAALDVQVRNGQASLESLTDVAERAHYRNAFAVAVAKSILAAIS